jgi:hypothetical protein
MGDFAARAVTGLAAGTAAAVMRGGKIAIQQVATDAFGNALGSGLADAMSTPSTTQTAWSGNGLRYGAAGETGFQVTGKTAMQWSAGVDRGVSAAAAEMNDGETPTMRDAVYRPGADDPYALMTANGGGYQYNPGRAGEAAAGLLRRADGVLSRLSSWSQDDVGPAFDSAILDAYSSGSDNKGRFLTGLRIVATASSDAVSGAAGLGRLFTSSDVRDAVATRAGEFLQDPVGNVTRAFNDWSSKAWHEQLEDVYKVFQSGAAGIGIAGKAKGLFSVGVLDDVAALGPNTQRVLGAYQSAYNDAAAALRADLRTGSRINPDGLHFNTWAGGQIDNAARAEMNAFKQLSGIDDLVVNRRLGVSNGIKDYRIPDLFLPGERTVIDGTIGTKGLTTPQIQDFFNSGKVDRVILVAPSQKPVIITLEQYLRSKR